MDDLYNKIDCALFKNIINIIVCLTPITLPAPLTSPYNLFLFDKVIILVQTLNFLFVLKKFSKPAYWTDLHNIYELISSKSDTFIIVW